MSWTIQVILHKEHEVNYKQLVQSMVCAPLAAQDATFDALSEYGRGYFASFSAGWEGRTSATGDWGGWVATDGRPTRRCSAAASHPQRSNSGDAAADLGQKW